jgi:hypothetical protein
VVKNSSRDGKVDQILSKYGLDRRLAQDYLKNVVYLNQTETADAMGVSRQTVQRYKEKIGEMTQGERVYLLAQLGEESLMELVHEVVTGPE